MNYLKIIEAAHAWEVKRRQINELHEVINSLEFQENDDKRFRIYHRIDGLEVDLRSIRNKLRKLIEQ